MQNPIAPEVFFGHVEKVKQTWSNVLVKKFQKSSPSMNSIILVNGKGTVGNEKTIAVFSWFLAGYNLADTILALTPTSINIYTSERKINFLNNLKDHPNAKKYGLTFHLKNENYQESYSKIWEELHGGNQQPQIGMLLHDTKSGQMAEEFHKFLQAKKHKEVDVTPFFEVCFMRKDAEEIENLKKSGKVTAYFEKKFIREIQVIIDSTKVVKHSDIVKKIQDMIGSESELKKCTLKIASESKLNLSKQYIDIGPPVTIQSGGTYKPKLFVEPNDKELKADCVVLSLGSLYRSYNTYVGRTLLIDPTDDQKQIYKNCETLLKIILQNLRVGVKISEVYRCAKKFMDDKLKMASLPQCFGFGIGIFLAENNLQITEDNHTSIQVGFAFLVNCTLPDIKYDSKRGPKSFMVQLIDTIVVGQKGQEVLTNDVSKIIADISYSLEDEEEAEKKENRQKFQNQPTTELSRSRRRTKQESTAQKLKNVKERNDHQGVLKKKKLEELKDRMNENFIGDFKKQKTVECSKLESYKTKNDLPKDLKKNMIYLDHKSNTILLPINGAHVPFHLHILKSVVRNDEGKYASLRFNFHLPNTVANLNFPKFTEPCVYIKEMVFRSQQLGRIAELEKQVKALQKKVRLETSEKHAKQDIIEQEKINLNKGKRPILRDLFARPGTGQKKTKGSLECHLNGFRYSTIKGEQIDVSFSNIKFSFFQPCEKEIIAAIHFKLNEPIMVGKKKTQDIQFYSQGVTNVEDVVGRGRGHGGDDSDDQERQKDARRKLDKDFHAWMKACQEYISKVFEFEVPKRSRGFVGTPFRSSSLIQPTKTCLINLTEMPFFVMCFDEIEVACFERMYANIKNFDVTFVMKDYEQNIRVNAIPIQDVERVKDLLDENNVVFYDSGKNLNWSKLLSGIRTDFKKFVEDGGWTAWDSDDEEGNEDAEDGDSEFSASSSDFGEDSEDSENSQSDFEQEKDSEDSEESDEQEELSEKGLSWDEMEERAEMEDREKVRRDLERQREMGQMKKR